MTPKLVLIAEESPYAQRLRGAVEQAGYRVISDGGGPEPGDGPRVMWLECPGGAEEMLSRLQALLSRSSPDRNSVLTVNGVRMDMRRGEADIGRGPAALSPKELHLLSYLASRPGVVITRDELLKEVWGYSTTGTRTVDSHVAALRRKLEADPRHPEHLLTVRGQGYQFRR